MAPPPPRSDRGDREVPTSTKNTTSKTSSDEGSNDRRAEKRQRTETLTTDREDKDADKMLVPDTNNKKREEGLCPYHRGRDTGSNEGTPSGDGTNRYSGNDNASAMGVKMATTTDNAKTDKQNSTEDERAIGSEDMGSAENNNTNADRKSTTSELQSHHDLVCRLLLEKKKKNKTNNKKKTTTNKKIKKQKKKKYK